MTHFNQSHVPILSKFRGDEPNNMTQKYNGHTNANSNVVNNQYQATVPTYTPSSHLHTANNDADKHRLTTNSYQHSNSSNALHQTPEITQDICSALLNQQTDAKRGKFHSDAVHLIISVISVSGKYSYLFNSDSMQFFKTLTLDGNLWHRVQRSLIIYRIYQRVRCPSHYIISSNIRLKASKKSHKINWGWELLHFTALRQNQTFNF